jgi:hypothetical protein
MAKSEPKGNGGLLLDVLKQIGLAGLDRLEQGTKAQEDSFVSKELQLSLGREQLQDLVKEARCLNHRCIVLPHFSKDGSPWVPLLWIILHSPEVISFQLIVASPNRTFGYRWESPEKGGSSESDHGFWHAQPLTSVRTYDGKTRSLNLTHTNICENFPTFPIDATNALELLGALLESLYGMSNLQKYITDARVRYHLLASTHRNKSAK